jgi:lambda repressor-like predicted transcriptional regulator
MDRKQKEALVLALSEKGKTYREITKEAGVSPNTIKAVLNKAGLDESTSISSRAFELYVQQKTPVQVAIALNLEAEIAIQYQQQFVDSNVALKKRENELRKTIDELEAELQKPKLNESLPEFHKFYEYKSDRCGSIFTEWYRLEIHGQVHDRKSKIKEYGSAEFNDYRLWDYKQGG